MLPEDDQTAKKKDTIESELDPAICETRILNNLFHLERNDEKV